MRLIYLSPVPWYSFSQRPHELVRYFHESTGGKVLWVDPYPGRFPALSDILNRRPQTTVDEGKVPVWLSVVKPRSLPIEPLPFSSAINRLFWYKVESTVDGFVDNATTLGIGKPTTLALRLLSRRCFKSSFYDAMDNYPAFYRGWSRVSMAHRERMTIKKVSTVLASSSKLHSRLQHTAPDVRLVLNACATERLPELANKRLLKKNKQPVVGYVGTIGNWFDWDLVIALANSHPDTIFRLIGPLYTKRPALPPNIFLAPALAHDEALLAMTQFDIGLIPFKKTSLTSSVDPIKFYEYRALGLPVVSSAFGEMMLRQRCEGVYLLESNSDMADVIERALTHSISLESTTQFRKDNSWQNRFNQANIFGL
ncbi:MAG: hypothetical protein ABS69_07160 [Nitrosomonadales bacterium SCN 54-20]|nr:MAG: hypothetical protein ABS69_07160 [Nitrosomonadales bacterium SCN 54-20]